MSNYGRYGNEKVTFVSQTPSGGRGPLGMQTIVKTEALVYGCLHAPIRRAEETPEWITDVATQHWKTTSPPDPSAMAITSTGQLIVNGITYQIVGDPQIVYDIGARPCGVVVFSKKQTG